MSYGGFDVAAISINAKRKAGLSEESIDPAKKFKALGSGPGIALLPDKQEEIDEDAEDDQLEEEVGNELPEEGDLDAILKLVDEAPELRELDINSVKGMVARLERAVNTNVQMRTKFAAKPDKFMDSEVALDEAITAIMPLAAAGHLYTDFVKLGAIGILLSLIGHENTDIGIAVVGLLNELMDVETLAGEEEDAMDIVDGLLQQNGLEVLVNFLPRLDEKNKEDFTAFHNTLGIFEALADVQPELIVKICSSTKLLKFLFNRLKRDGFDENKLYASEMLSILIQGSDNAVKVSVGLGRECGLLVLLKSIHRYRRRDPETEEETEYVQNLFGSLCMVLHQNVDNQNRFAKAEGIQLMIAVIRKKKFAKHGALKSLNFALSENKPNLDKFVDAGGLKTLFWFFMKQAKKKDIGFQQENEEHVIGIITQCFVYLADVRFLRLAKKFQESEFEKVERLMELYNKYARQVEDAEKKWKRENPFHRRKKQLENEADQKTQEKNDEEEYLRRIEAGLLTLQQTCLALGFVSTMGDKKMFARLEQLLDQQDSSLLDIHNRLVEFHDSVGSEGNSGKMKLKAIIGSTCEMLLDMVPNS